MLTFQFTRHFQKYFPGGSANSKLLPDIEGCVILLKFRQLNVSVRKIPLRVVVKCLLKLEHGRPLLDFLAYFGTILISYKELTLEAE